MFVLILLLLLADLTIQRFNVLTRRRHSHPRESVTSCPERFPGSHPIFSHLNPTPPISTETCFSRKMSWPQFINSLTHQLNNWILLPIGPDSSRSHFIQLPVAPDTSRSILFKTGATGTYRDLPGAIGTKIKNSALCISVPAPLAHINLAVGHVACEFFTGCNQTEHLPTGMSASFNMRQLAH